ncbi:Bestrophin/UPF0187 [Kalmanozyma brasiliensis GHG001]|uniref:Bestrophin/UPF0187 n=1 Tax=Kalmanozyma brasiliensis (strain GHG001) TaxID=1365824 RepID=UPI00286816FD|nr:Bestrophin/UPF0187 [Kalmanozyma brasiliensis GHG001]KAF6767562.1 Bestrophin/UPF0187 [Kalmanozyma brasiliensis GHG001]
MLEPFLKHLHARIRDVLHPTLVALLWLSFLIVVKHACLTPTSLSWRTPAPSSLNSTSSSNHVGVDECWDLSQLWKDLEWASYRIIASLSTVTGLLLAFRSNSAIERWSTARRKWSDVQATSRSLLRLLGASLLAQGCEDPKSNEDFAKRRESRARVEATLATIPFFSISLMCEMRGRALHLLPGAQESLLRSDFVDVLPPQLIALANRHHGEPSADDSDGASQQEKRKQIANLNSPHIRRPPPTSPDPGAPNLALTSLILLQQSLDDFHSSSLLCGPVYAHSIGLLNSLSSHMTDLERIRDTPIPFAVSTHFSRLLAIHTCLLPVVVVQRLGGERWWLASVVVGVVTTMLYGVDSFAAKLGQPMGLDREDLPLERYVGEVQREWADVRGSCAVNG